MRSLFIAEVPGTKTANRENPRARDLSVEFLLPIWLKIAHNLLPEELAKLWSRQSQLDVFACRSLKVLF